MLCIYHVIILYLPQRQFPMSNYSLHFSVPTFIILFVHHLIAQISAMMFLNDNSKGIFKFVQIHISIKFWNLQLISPYTMFAF